MAVQDATTLKSYFNTGDVPTESQFADLIDTIDSKGSGGVTDHGALTGLDDNDHPQYSLTTHNHTGTYEPADATIVKDSDIGVTVAAFSHTHNYAPALGADDNYMTDAEKTKLSGIADGAEVNVNADWNATSGDAQILNKPIIPSVSGLLDETTHDLLDHTGLTGIPSITGLLDETAHDLLDHTGLTGIPTVYTDEMAQDAVGAAIAAGTQSGITVTYDDANNKIDFTVTATGTGDVTGPAGSVDSNFALFNGTTGKIIKDGSVKASDFATASHNHTGVYQPAGTYSTDIHSNITALNAVSGTNTGDQDLSGYSLTSHNHAGVYEPADATILKDAAIGVTVQAYDADLTSWAGKTAPSSTVVGTTDTQTLTNKTIEAASLTNGYTEEVYELTGTEINPVNGSIQHKILSGNTTFTESLSAGQSVTLMLNPSTFAATWPTTTWIGTTVSTAPALVASVYNCFTFFKIAGTLYGKYEGRV